MKELRIHESELARGYGRSTGEALVKLGNAIMHPNTVHLFSDHFGTVDADKLQMKIAMDIAGKLGLDNLKFNGFNNSVVCESIIEVND